MKLPNWLCGPFREFFVFGNGPAPGCLLIVIEEVLVSIRHQKTRFPNRIGHIWRNIRTIRGITHQFSNLGFRFRLWEIRLWIECESLVEAVIVSSILAEKPLQLSDSIYRVSIQSDMFFSAASLCCDLFAFGTKLMIFVRY
ncbi:MAG TPA: hypothetical protein VGK24_05630 [Candidatus Angelobacter sp.]|jgi:hypothetical protein